MEIISHMVSSVSVVRVTGSIDALTSSQMDSYLQDLVGRGQSRLLLDLGSVDFMSSAGLRSILNGMKAARQNAGDLRLVNAQSGVENILKLSGFSSILKTYADLDQALADYADHIEGSKPPQGDIGVDQSVSKTGSDDHV